MNSLRFQPLDSLRGLAVIGMILVVSPGSWFHGFSQLRHAEWVGWTMADIVMPLFLFCVGMALGIKFYKQQINNASLYKAIKRSCLLILVGLILAWLETGDINRLRIPGILQRIALCYFLAVLLIYFFNKKLSTGLSIMFCVICALNLTLMDWFALGANANGELTIKDNLAAVIDRSLFGVNHLWIWGKDSSGSVVYDPDGLLTTLFASANVLGGVLVLVLRENYQSKSKLEYFYVLALIAFGFVLAAYVTNPFSPINKTLWSTSFTLLSIGVCVFLLLCFECFYSFSDCKEPSLLNPLHVFGSNAILAFTISTLLVIYSGTPLIKVGNETLGMQNYVYSIVKQFIDNPNLASLLCAVLVLFSIYLLILPLAIKKIYLKF